MQLTTIILIALALSLDAFAVAIASGIIIKKNRTANAFKLALCFGLFQTVMPVAGWLGGRGFSSVIGGIDHWLAFGTLFIIGAKMVYEATKIEALEIAPENLCVRTLAVLGVATSLDALAVGLSLSFLRVSIVFPVAVIGIITFTMSYAGFFIGNSFGRSFEKKAQIVAGMILIGIGLKILFEHLFR